jgi:asparagine synthase (glutamine-hydrolysing)
MCGITGIISNDSNKYKNQANKMLDAIIHRGPDGSGIVTFPKAILGHRRLSIIDLSTGNQPMYNNDQSVALVFNGEIYGYQNIKENLPNYKFKTSSDTETILALYETYGQKFLDRLPGMFSFALWDNRTNSLLAARDRFGEKPFYYAIGKNGEFIFASEIKAILASGLIEPILDEESLAHYLHKLYVHPTKTIYKNVFTLPPAHALILKDGKYNISRYWNLPNLNEKISLDEALPKFKELFENAVKKQLVADVPVGAFLSGGLDSTTVVALASKFSPKIKTFSFGYEGTKNELPFAKLASEQYKTDHFELHDKDNNIAELLIKMADVYDEPFADSSNISTYLISKLTRNHVTVVLTGDGGDELLGGYYGWYRSLITMTDNDLKSFPGKVLIMKIMSQILLRTNYRNKARLITRTRGLYYRNKFKTVLDAHKASNVYFTEKEISKLGINCKITKTKPSWITNNTVDDAMKNDIENYMPGDILVKIDRASMANSIELRAPFLDVPFAEFALSLPFRLKIDENEEKLIMRRAFSDLWPEAIRKRSKIGFGAPTKIWMKKPDVIKLMELYLNDKNKKIFKYISFENSRKYINSNDYKAWILLTLSIWMEKHTFK